ncbi:alpha/beta hydrolase [Lacrimispora sp.]|uniref:alpha/beta hydrolase n=1 Tax=Lacrimispora sp. TaxID=2719234 RepID=UPI002FDA2392
MRGKKVSVRGNLVRDMMQNVMETSLKQPIQTGELRKNPVEPAWVRPAGYEYEIIEIGHLRMEYLRPVGVVTGRVILQLHGGGYIGPMKNIYRRFAVRYSKVSYGGDVLTLDYRVAPENPYPAALEDAVAAYEWLVKEKGYCPENIVVAGDSAGGGLGLALGLYLKDQGMALPSGFITMSPWTDLTNSGESYVSNYETDPLFGNSTDNMLYNSSYIGESDPRDPYMSPLFGEYENFSPVLMQVGSYEVLLSDTLIVAEKLKKAGVKRRLSVYEGMFHVFQMALDLIPESREAWNEVEEFLRIIYHINVKPDGKVVRKIKTENKGLAADMIRLVIAAMKKGLDG